MNFLAIDTSGRHLTVLVQRGEKRSLRYLPDCAHDHSVVLMDEVDAAFRETGLTPGGCDFFAAVVGPGSFTGIRIGISTVKGLAFAAEKPALAVTSFDCIAYAEEGDVLALLDAGRGEYYVCGYDSEKKIVLPPAILAAENAKACGKNPCSATELFPGCKQVNVAEGLHKAVLSKASSSDMGGLSAFYLRKSAAEEGR